MRLRRSTPGLPDEASPPALRLVQLGDKFHPIPLNAPPKAEKLLFGSMRLSKHDSHTGISPPNDAREGYEALARMKEALAEPDVRSSKYAWSPDHLGQPHPYDSQPYHSRNPEKFGREPSDASLPGYHEPYASQHLSPPPSECPDMAIHQSPHTIFDDVGEHRTARRHSSLEAMKQHQVSRRQTTGHAKSLQLNHMFPTPRPSTGRLLSPNRDSASPLPTENRGDRPLPPIPPEPAKPATRKARFVEAGVLRPSKSAGGLTGKKKVFDEDILDQHKTNVRRPPKGIQNWFDAYLESEDEEDDEEEEDPVPEPMRGPPMDIPEPQELPADDILPPAYSAPSREMSRASEKSGSETRPAEYHHQPTTQQVTVTTAEQEEISRYRSSDTNSWDSIQSSHIGRIPPDGDSGEVEASAKSLGGQSVLSLSESEYGDTDEESDGRLPPIRDSIFDDKNVVFASASSVALHKLQRPSQLREMSSFGQDSEAKASRSNDAMSSKPSSLTSNTTPRTQKGDKPSPGAPGDSLHPTAEQVALRRLNGLSTESHSTSNSDAAIRDSAESQPPVDAQHVMAVTEEEKMLLDLMRRKRAVMQQLSFTEGYQLALLTEQQRLAKRAASAELRALKSAHPKISERRDSQVETVPSPTRSGSESDMRRQLSAIRKEQVDERFQLERFLGMSQPQPLSSHPPYDASQQTTTAEFHNNRQSGELLPATVYSPSTTPSGPSPAMTQGSFPPEGNDSDAVKRRVRYFIETKGAVPPLNTTLKTMRRKSNRAVASMPPSPVIEEENPPAIPMRSPDRRKRELSGASNSTANTYHTLNHKQSSVSMDDEPRDKSPVSSFAPPMSRFNSMRQSQNIDIRLSPELVASRSTDSFLNHDQVSQPSNDSPVSHTNGVSPVSPFSSIIASAASKPNNQPHNNNINQDNLPRGVKRIPQLPRLHTVEALDSRGSLLSITSAGEEVLAAWNELGGKNDYLPPHHQTKHVVQKQPQVCVQETDITSATTYMTPRTPGQGPLSHVMNSHF